MAKRQFPPDRHVFAFRVPEDMEDRIRFVLAHTRRTLSAEMVIAVERYLDYIEPLLKEHAGNTNASAPQKPYKPDVVTKPKTKAKTKTVRKTVKKNGSATAEVF